LTGGRPRRAITTAVAVALTRSLRTDGFAVAEWRFRTGGQSGFTALKGA